MLKVRVCSFSLLYVSYAERLLHFGVSVEQNKTSVRDVQSPCSDVRGRILHLEQRVLCLSCRSDVAACSRDEELSNLYLHHFLHKYISAFPHRAKQTVTCENDGPMLRPAVLLLSVWLFS